VSARRGPSFGDRFAGLKITRGALIIAGLEVGLSLVWLMSNPAARAGIEDWVAATPSNVFEHGRVWTLVTSPFLEKSFLGLILHVMVLWMFVPTLERFWGTPRFYRFVAVTSIVGTAAGVTMGLLLDRNEAILGLSPFMYASIVAFGIVYARQPVQFFGVLPLTGRQLMYGFLGFVSLFVLIQQLWWLAAAFGAAMIAAALMTSKRFSPGLAWKRWRIAKARAKLSVIEGGKPREKKPSEKWLN
jgi:membrane associated rhomboid family serine protease